MWNGISNFWYSPNPFLTLSPIEVKKFQNQTRIINLIGEMKLDNILKKSTINSLILGDEMCNSTEMISAISIFVAGLEELHKNNKKIDISKIRLTSAGLGFIWVIPGFWQNE